VSNLANVTCASLIRLISVFRHNISTNCFSDDVKTRLVVVGQGAGAQVHNVEKLQSLFRNSDQTTGDQEGVNQLEEEFSLR
jgi:hypothetical protein